MAAEPRHRREIVTPEGVPIGLGIADAGERVGAFAIDLVIVTAVVVLLALLAGMASGASLREGSWGISFVLLAAFLVRNFYFVFFELRWRGQTPGKRAFKLRVVDARGGALGSEAVVARNLVRDVEVFVPLTIVFASDQVWPGISAWGIALASLWCLVLVFLPLFSKERTRVGDLVGGTRVVAAPRVFLLSDLAGRAPSARDGGYAFSDAQLDVYGVYELQVLENVLRGEDGIASLSAIDAVFERVRDKIEWKEAGRVDRRRFLEDYYVALRARLERKMLFGKRKADKHDR
jgi:uncharacterized RDD family membrane protein YckC